MNSSASSQSQVLDVDARLRAYFHCRQYAGLGAAGSDWIIVDLGHASTGEQLSWGVVLSEENVREARYRVQGSVVLTACCAKAAEWLQGRTLDQAICGVTPHLADFFEIKASQMHVPHMFVQALRQIQQKLG
jgi:hypothetical protein